MKKRPFTSRSWYLERDATWLKADLHAELGDEITKFSDRSGFWVGKAIIGEANDKRYHHAHNEEIAYETSVASAT